MANSIELREIRESDLPIFYEQQLDPDAAAMAAFPSREREVFMEHWHKKVFPRTDVTNRTVLYNGEIAGNILCYPDGDATDVGYWYGREYWGKGIASEALRQLLEIVTVRPLRAFVSKTNPGSQRVLEKCGFVVTGEESFYSEQMNQQINKVILTLE